jgi:hypothetical protein
MWALRSAGRLPGSVPQQSRSWKQRAGQAPGVPRSGADARHANGVILGLVPRIPVRSARELLRSRRSAQPGFSGRAFGLPENDSCGGALSLFASLCDALPGGSPAVPDQVSALPFVSGNRNRQVTMPMMPKTTGYQRPAKTSPVAVAIAKAVIGMKPPTQPMPMW